MSRRLSKGEANAAAIIVRKALKPGAWDNAMPAPEEWDTNRSNMAGWFGKHYGKDVDTLQVSLREWEVCSAWQPGPRKVEEVSSSGVRMDGSFAEFTGTMVHIGETCMIRSYAFGESIVVTFYRVN